MPNTYSQLYAQIIFAVQGRKHFIKEELRENLQKYIAGIITGNKQKLYAIYCMPDHTHVFISYQPNIAISDIARDIKASSSGWLKGQHPSLKSFSWQEGFGAFSYSKSQSKNVVGYVLNQPIHHKKKTFEQEYIAFLKALDVEYDTRYLFEFYND
jgi:REP element-mobilizing transposase RayT